MENTRVALLNELYDWSRDESAPRIFWLDGMAGTGKSAVARSFGRILDAEGRLGGSFFCSRIGLAEQGNVKRIIPTLVSSLARRSADFKAALLAALENGDFSFHTNLDVQVRFLVDTVNTGLKRGDSCTFIFVIDAVDECADEDLTKDVLSRLIAVFPNLPLKLFVTSRPEPQIRSRMETSNSSSRRILRLHDIEKDIVAADISTYLNKRLDDICDERPDLVPSDLKWPSPEDIRALTEQFGVLFIYAFTAVKFIEDDPVYNLSSLIRTCSFEGGTHYLDALYTRILNVACGTSSRRANIKRILAGILTAREPLTERFLARWFHFASGVPHLRSLLDRLHAVVHIPRDESGSLSVFHASFGDFLTSPDRAPEDMLLSLSDGHCDFSDVCISFMRSDELHFHVSGYRTSYLFNHEQPTHAEISDQLIYASTHWAHHFVCAADSSHIGSLLIKLDAVLRQKFLFWVELLSATDRSERALINLMKVLGTKSLVSGQGSSAKTLTKTLHSYQKCRRSLLAFSVMRMSSSYLH
jgi:hypothetical protein